MSEAYIIALRNKLRWDAGNLPVQADDPRVTERLWMWVRTMGDLRDKFDQLRRQSRRFASARQAEDGKADPRVDVAEAAVQRADLREAMDVLPAAQRTIVEAIYFGGMSQVEVAKVMKISQPAVSQALDRAFAKMRDKLGDRYNG